MCLAGQLGAKARFETVSVAVVGFRGAHYDTLPAASPLLPQFPRLGRGSKKQS